MKSDAWTRVPGSRNVIVSPFGALAVVLFNAFNECADTHERIRMNSAFNTFLLVLAAIFPVVNPPGSALVFLGLTRGATPEIRRVLARRVAINSFFVLVCSLLLGALILEFYGI